MDMILTWKLQALPLENDIVGDGHVGQAVPARGMTHVRNNQMDGGRG